MLWLRALGPEWTPHPSLPAPLCGAPALSPSSAQAQNAMYMMLNCIKTGCHIFCKFLPCKFKLYKKWVVFKWEKKKVYRSYCCTSMRVDEELAQPRNSSLFFLLLLLIIIFFKGGSYFNGCTESHCKELNPRRTLILAFIRLQLVALKRRSKVRGVI